MQSEQVKIREYVVKQTMEKMKLTKVEASERVDALVNSGILKGGTPDDRWYQLLIENFIRFDLSKLNYTEVFQDTLHFPELILEYDKREGQHLTSVRGSLRNGTYDYEDAKAQIEAFDHFFCKHIWNYFPGVQKY